MTSPALNKTTIALLAGVAMLQLASGPASAAPQPVKAFPATATEAPVAPGQGRDTAGADDSIVTQIIASSVISRGGKTFPLVTGAGTRSTTGSGASCEIGDTQGFDHGARIDIEGTDHASTSTVFGPNTTTYSPPNAEWVIQSYNRVIDSVGSAYSASDSAIPAGFVLNTSANYSAVQSSLDSYILSLNIPNYVKADLNAQISTFVSNISSYGYAISSSHGAVQHSGTVYGTGKYNTHVGHSWYHGWINGSLVCAPAYLHDQAALTGRLKTWVNGVVARIPVRIPVAVRENLEIRARIKH